MTSEIIIGNVCSLCALASDSIAGTRKKTDQILGIQIISQFFYAAGSIVLKGYSSTAQNAAAVLRNLAAMKRIKSKAIEWSLIALGVVLGIVLNNRGLLGFLPIVANLEYSIAVFRFKDNEKLLKIALIVNLIMFSAFSLVISNYVGVAANLVVAAATFISMIKTARAKKKGGAEKTAEE
ncbi:MAG: YgjV family protein [Clostridia bacterium]|nr:YgjV family protein [Clostridia bacterium]